MAQSALMRSYYEELNEANKRIFDLRSTVADLNEKLHSKAEPLPDNAAANNSERVKAAVQKCESKHAREKDALRFRCEELDRQVITLTQQLEAASGEIAQLRERLELKDEDEVEVGRQGIQAVAASKRKRGNVDDLASTPRRSSRYRPTYDPLDERGTPSAEESENSEYSYRLRRDMINFTHDDAMSGGEASADDLQSPALKKQRLAKGKGRGKLPKTKKGQDKATLLTKGYTDKGRADDPQDVTDADVIQIILTRLTRERNTLAPAYFGWYGQLYADRKYVLAMTDENGELLIPEAKGKSCVDWAQRTKYESMIDKLRKMGRHRGAGRRVTG